MYNLLLGNARQLADKEEIDVRTYSIIYDAINDVKDAMEGMLAPTVEEVITGNIEVREVFKISKIQHKFFIKIND